MDAVSRVAGALMFACVTSVALAVEPPPSRAVVFEGEIGDGLTQLGTWLNLDRWPSVGDGGDGLRFRFASETVVVGTVYEGALGADSLWAARWQVCDIHSRAALPASGLAGTLVADANRDGNIVGAVILPNSNTIAAAAWKYSSGTLDGEPGLHLAFGPGGIANCYGIIPGTMLSAVGPRTAPSGSAMIAGIGGLVSGGGWPDGFVGELQLSGGFDDVMRLPGTNSAGWCDT